eukprot:SAG22_NODE_161_length_16908_cov_39.687965_5_plen_224_part_00
MGWLKCLHMGVCGSVHEKYWLCFTAAAASGCSSIMLQGVPVTTTVQLYWYRTRTSYPFIGLSNYEPVRSPTVRAASQLPFSRCAAPCTVATAHARDACRSSRRLAPFVCALPSPKTNRRQHPPAIPCPAQDTSTTGHDMGATAADPCRPASRGRRRLQPTPAGLELQLLDGGRGLLAHASCRKPSTYFSEPGRCGPAGSSGRGQRSPPCSPLPSLLGPRCHGA